MRQWNKIIRFFCALIQKSTKMTFKHKKATWDFRILEFFALTKEIQLKVLLGSTLQLMTQFNNPPKWFQSMWFLFLYFLFFICGYVVKFLQQARLELQVLCKHLLNVENYRPQMMNNKSIRHLPRSLKPIHHDITKSRLLVSYFFVGEYHWICGIKYVLPKCFNF